MVKSSDVERLVDTLPETPQARRRAAAPPSIEPGDDDREIAGDVQAFGERVEAERQRQRHQQAERRAADARQDPARQPAGGEPERGAPRDLPGERQGDGGRRRPCGPTAIS